MIYPTITTLTQDGKFNRYELALATAKCARMITNEYTRQRNIAESQMTGNKETDKPLNTMIDKELRDVKAVKLAIGRIEKNQYTIVHKDPALQEQEELAILAGLNQADDLARFSDEDDELGFSEETASPTDGDEDILDDEIIDDTMNDVPEDKETLSENGELLSDEDA